MTDTQREAFEAWYVDNCPDIITEPIGCRTFTLQFGAWQAALTQPQAQQAAAVLAGWKLVPIEPTKEMLDAYVAQDGRFNSARADWAAMLTSAPAAPQALSENDHVMESWLCESRRLVLRIGQLYRFKVDPTCATCVAMKAEHDSAYGAAGITVWEGG